jgi:hypothetical protein
MGIRIFLKSILTSFVRSCGQGEKSFFHHFASVPYCNIATVRKKMLFKHYFIVFLCIMYSYQLAVRLIAKKHKWVFCGDHIDYVFFYMARQLYDTLIPNVLGSFQCAKLTLVLLEVGV